MAIAPIPNQAAKKLNHNQIVHNNSTSLNPNLFFTTDYPNKTNIINQAIEKLIISSLILFETIDRI